MTVLESKRINNFFKKELIVLSFYKKTKQDLTFCTYINGVEYEKGITLSFQKKNSFGQRGIIHGKTK